jgi:hypothetical protein
MESEGRYHDPRIFLATGADGAGLDYPDMIERTEAILGYDALGEWTLGKIRPFRAPALQEEVA